jgi:hypothetical protein
MKIKDAVRMLNEYYSPEDEVAIAWWDKDSAESLVDNELTSKEWTEIIEALDNEDHLFDGVHISIEEAYAELKEEKANG